MNKPVVNEDENVRIIRELRKEVAELREKLNRQHASGPSEIERRIESSEHLVEKLTDEFTIKWATTTELMERRQLKLEGEGLVVKLRSERPHFVNFNLNDPLVSAVSIVYLKDGNTTFGLPT